MMVPRYFHGLLPIMLIAAAVAAPLTSSAADGVLEINQACAVAGCFSGDSSGFPVTINSGGAYVLTSDLDVRDETTPEDVNAIEVAVSGAGSPQGVRIDLNGFRIVGPNLCSNTPVVSCSAIGTGVGVFSLNNRIWVGNGRILGMGGNCIDVVSTGIFEDLHIEDCGGNGLETGRASRIRNVTVQRNFGDGIVVTSQSCLVTNSVITGNMGTGLVASGSTGYGFNVIASNTGGDVTGGIQIATNICTASACP